MDYTRIYCEFILDRLAVCPGKKTEGYEDHHIHPDSMGGGNERENMVFLTLEDHLFAHKVLAHATNDQKMWHALDRMLGFKKYKGRTTRAVYAKAKRLARPLLVKSAAKLSEREKSDPVFRAKQRVTRVENGTTHAANGTGLFSRTDAQRSAMGRSNGARAKATGHANRMQAQGRVAFAARRAAGLPPLNREVAIRNATNKEAALRVLMEGRDAVAKALQYPALEVVATACRAAKLNEFYFAKYWEPEAAKYLFPLATKRSAGVYGALLPAEWLTISAGNSTGKTFTPFFTIHKGKAVPIRPLPTNEPLK